MSVRWRSGFGDGLMARHWLGNALVACRYSSRMNDNVSDAALQQLARELGAAAQSNHHSLVTAESCTGGWIAKVLTDIAGSSAWFECGIAAYSYESKQALLGVRPETLE